MILEYRNNAWKFQPHAAGDRHRRPRVATFANTRNAKRRRTSAATSRLATFNVLNYFNTTGEAWVGRAAGAHLHLLQRTAAGNADRQQHLHGGWRAGRHQGPRGAATTASLNRQQAKIVRAINNLDADIVSLEEIENSLTLGETDRDDAVKTLVAALNAQAGTHPVGLRALAGAATCRRWRSRT